MIGIEAVKAAAAHAGVDLSPALAVLEKDKFIIESLEAMEILDSRGNPTVEVDLKTKGG
eukprot:CAMPEP_0176067416 /NCGR_PEP_ID=MMETSP0120_2-20121206/33651_1 /TAXON_ID=160619 /ORGANISM="Kryptoperidinium foliaceum, Strain CCMP 1326" /LENGTH=58 /DNA_ID=CAMNT_0017401035 /DNA_START=23 /DNA_END=195 /DNA_ORIENTATION=+